MMEGVSSQTRRAYSEVYGILEILGEYYIQKLPDVIYQNIKKLKLEDYNPKYSDEKSLKSQHISRDAISMIAFFDLSYWCENKEEKNRLKKLFLENENKNTNIFDKDYKKIDNTENVKSIVENAEIEQSKLEMIEYKENIFSKIINKIKTWLKL